MLATCVLSATAELSLVSWSQGGTAITTDLSQNDRAVHIDFFNGRPSSSVH